MKRIHFLLLMLVSTLAQSQVYHYYSRTTTKYTYGPYYFATTMSFVNKVYEDKKQKEYEQQMAEKMKKRIVDIKDYYTSLKTYYPTTVSNGWHEVVLLVGDEYIDDAKAHVSGNKIDRMVWDDFVEQELTFSGPIIEGKTGFKIKDGSGPFEGLINAYFINYIADKNSQATAPPTPGRVTFWTDNKQEYQELYAQFEDAVVGPFTTFSDRYSRPECYDEKQVSIIYKPGKYSFKALKKSGGSSYKTLYEGTVIIEEGGCTRIQIDHADRIIKEEEFNKGNLKPGQVKLWTNNKKLFSKFYLEFDGQRYGPLTSFHKLKNGIPNCSSEDMFSLSYRPGQYHYKVVKLGPPSISHSGYNYITIMEGELNIESGGCKTLQLNYPDEMNK